METRLAREARKISFSKKHLSLILGTLLGDGYLDRTTRGYSLRIHHGISQKEYVDFKYNVLKLFVNSRPKQSGNSYYFRTVSHPYLNYLRNIFYLGKKKIIPRKFLEENLDPFAFAIWIMDDGARDWKQLRINTQSFSLDENLWLTQFLQAKFGILARINRDRGNYRLRIGASSMQILKS